MATILAVSGLIRARTRARSCDVQIGGAGWWRRRRRRERSGADAHAAPVASQRIDRPAGDPRVAIPPLLDKINWITMVYGRPDYQLDLHQHIWTEPLLDALALRRGLPFVRRTVGLTVLHSAGERPYGIDVRSETPDRRTRLLHDERIDRALIALSSPIGIEALPEDAAAELIAAHLDGVLALGDEFAAWGPIAVERPDPDQVDRLLARGCVGVSLPAGALAGDAALARIGPILERVAISRVPLPVHPGPTARQGTCEASLTEPLWWRALTDYV